MLALRNHTMTSTPFVFYSNLWSHPLKPICPHCFRSISVRKALCLPVEDGAVLVDKDMEIAGVISHHHSHAGCQASVLNDLLTQNHGTPKPTQTKTQFKTAGEKYIHHIYTNLFSFVLTWYCIVSYYWSFCFFFGRWSFGSSQVKISISFPRSASSSRAARAKATSGESEGKVAPRTWSPC